MRAVAGACFLMSRQGCAVRWYSELQRQFGSDPGIVLRLLSALVLRADPGDQSDLRRVRSEAIDVLGRTGGDPHALRTLFDEHLSGDAVPKAGLALLALDPEAGPAARTLLRWYGAR
jgi:hypothetical protein